MEVLDDVGHCHQVKGLSCELGVFGAANVNVSRLDTAASSCSLSRSRVEFG